MLRVSLIGFVTTAGVVLAAPRPKDPPPKDSPIIGQWKLTQTDGNDTDKRIAEWVEEFRADGSHVGRTRFGKEEIEETGRYAIDPKADPAHFDFISDEPADDMKGIFQVKGNILTICFQVQRAAPRPKKFKVVPNEFRVFVYERIKAKE